MHLESIPGPPPLIFIPYTHSSSSRVPIQILEEARDAVQTIHVGPTTITAGSIDGHVRVYDLRKGELRADYLGRKRPPLTVEPSP